MTVDEDIKDRFNVVYSGEMCSSKCVFKVILETDFVLFFCSQSGFEPSKVSAPLLRSSIGALLPVAGCADLILSTDYSCLKEAVPCVFKVGWFALSCPSFTSSPCAV